MKTKLHKFNVGDTVICTWGTNKGKEFIVRYAYNDGYVLKREGSEKEYYYAERLLEMKLVIGKRYIVEYAETDPAGIPNRLIRFTGVYYGKKWTLLGKVHRFYDEDTGEATYLSRKDFTEIIEEGTK